MGRKLASIQQITNIRPIAKADRIDVADVLGWHVVVGKGDYNIGDLCIYVEIDSILPNEDWSQLLVPKDRKFNPKPKDFRILTRKFRKQISQGITFPLNILYDKITLKAFEKLKDGDDVTKSLGITKYEPWKKPVRYYEKAKEDLNIFQRIKEWWFQRTYWKKKKKFAFPTYVPKTKESRIQASPSILKNHQGDLVFATEKIDGCSGTFILLKDKFIVCSRNRHIKNGGYNSQIYWKAAENEDVEMKLRKYGGNIAIQGEIIGGNSGLDSGIGVKNKYARPELEIYVFNVWDINEHRYYDHFEMEKFYSKTKFKRVPKLPSFTLPNIEDLEDGETLTDRIVKLSQGMSLVNPKYKREGFVVRSRNMVNGKPEFSFKCINPKFLLIKGSHGQS